jgi:hypothetical protein
LGWTHWIPWTKLQEAGRHPGVDVAEGLERRRHRVEIGDPLIGIVGAANREDAGLARALALVGGNEAEEDLLPRHGIGRGQIDQYLVVRIREALRRRRQVGGIVFVHRVRGVDELEIEDGLFVGRLHGCDSLSGLRQRACLLCRLRTNCKSERKIFTIDAGICEPVWHDTGTELLLFGDSIVGTVSGGDALQNRQRAAKTGQCRAHECIHTDHAVGSISCSRLAAIEGGTPTKAFTSPLPLPISRTSPQPLEQDASSRRAFNALIG